MKKWLSLIISVILVLSFTGCQQKMELQEDETVKKAPEYIQGIYKNLNNLAVENTLSYVAHDFSEGDGNTSFEFYLLEYNYKKSKYGQSIYSVNFSKDTPERGFHMSRTNNRTEEIAQVVLIDFITSLIQISDASINFDSAKEKAQKLYNSCPTEDSETRYSDILECGEYILSLSRDGSYKGLEPSFHYVKNSLMFNIPESEKSKYYERYENEADKYYKFKGTIQDVVFSKWGKHSSFSVVSESDEKCIFIYDYSETPIQFKEGQTYTFYGENYITSSLFVSGLVTEVPEGRELIDLPIILHNFE